MRLEIVYLVILSTFKCFIPIFIVKSAPSKNFNYIKIADVHEHYVLENELLSNHNASSEIYLARRKKDEREVVIKIPINGYYDDEAAIVNEVRIISKLDHETIVKTADLLYKTIYSNNTAIYFIILEKSNGITLKEFMETREVCDFKKVIKILRNILIGLEYLHENDVVHGDLKPTDILIDCGKITILDFGLASDAKIKKSKFHFDINQRRRSRQIAPEIASGSQYTTAADMYSFGIIMQEIKRSADFQYSLYFKEKELMDFYDLQDFCLNLDYKERISATDALRGPLFKPLLPIFYRFAHLKNFFFKSQSMQFNKLDNVLFIRYFRDGRFKRIKIQEKQPLKHSIHILVEADLSLFLISIDGKESNVYSILNEDLVYISAFFRFMKLNMHKEKYFEKKEPCLERRSYSDSKLYCEPICTIQECEINLF